MWNTFSRLFSGADEHCIQCESTQVIIVIQAMIILIEAKINIDCSEKEHSQIVRSYDKEIAIINAMLPRIVSIILYILRYTLFLQLPAI